MAINAYYHVTPAGAGAKNGNDWDNAFDEPAWETFMEGGGLAAGDVIIIKEGTYTLDSDIDFSAINGTVTAPIALIGVKDTTTNVGAAVVYSDWARTAGDRPFFDTATFQFKTGSYTIIRNVSIQGAGNDTLEMGIVCAVENCKIENDNGVSTNTNALKMTTYAGVINCEITSANTNGVSVAQYGKVHNCYFHDFTGVTYGSALTLATHGGSVVSNIFNTAKIGINSGTSYGYMVSNNTFYECDTAVSGTSGGGNFSINNIVEGSNADGFKWTTQTDNNFFWGNHGDDTRCTDMWDGVDITTVFQDYEVSTGDPKFTTAGSDFSLQSDSPNINNANGITDGVGATPVTGNQGAWQGNEPGGGGGGNIFAQGIIR